MVRALKAIISHWGCYGGIAVMAKWLKPLIEEAIQGINKDQEHHRNTMTWLGVGTPSAATPKAEPSVEEVRGSCSTPNQGTSKEQPNDENHQRKRRGT
jgi:hypothetical protein